MNTARSLYHITNDLETLLATEEWDEAMEAAIDGVQEEFTAKVGNVASYVQYLGDQANVLREREKAFAAQRRVMEAKRDRLLKYLHANLEQVEAHRVRDDARGLTVSLAKNPPKAVINETALPRTYFVKPAPVIDRQKVLAALKAGKKVRGASLEQGTRVKIG